MPIRDYETRKSYNKKYRRKQPSIRKSSLLKKNFYCFDGESENDKYTLLGSSKEYIYNKKGLSSYDCLYFLYNTGKNTIKIIFAIHYDIQFWIKDLPDELIIKVLSGEEITWKIFTLRYFTKKFLILSILGRKIYIYDISSFFQTSFLETIKKMDIQLTKRQQYILNLGKTLRTKNFEGMNKKEIIEYNKTECVITEKIADKLRLMLINTTFEYGKKFNLYTNRFYGVGAVASKILQQLNMDKFAVKESELSLSIKKYIYGSYYGGRAEVYKIGTFRNVYKYDINSAYPYVISQLKQPINFKIKKINKTFTQYNFVDGNIYHITFDFTKFESTYIGILPIRRKDGYVLYPKRGKGYYFGCECKYLNYYCKLGVGFFRIHAILDITYSNDLLFPKGFIEYIYKKRQELKAAEDITQIVYKLSMDSIYGKLAQQTGNKKYTNILAASYITSYCRSVMMSTILNNNCMSNVIQISTDGLFCNAQLKNILINNKLGGWREDRYKVGIILGAGLYGLYDKKNIFALRGIIVNKENFEKIYHKLLHVNEGEISYKVFIGHKLAIANYKAYGQYRLKFSNIIKTIRPFDYEKRIFIRKGSLKYIHNNYWYDIFKSTQKIDTYSLIKIKEDLEEEAIKLII